MSDNIVVDTGAKCQRADYLLSPTTVGCQPKIGAKIISKIHDAQKNNKPFYSFEFFPPKTEAGVENLYARIFRLTSEFEPAFVDMTWGAGGSTADLTLEISSIVQSECASDVMMHLTCTNMHLDTIKDALNKARAAGIRNILALRGDPPLGVEVWEKTDDSLCYAADLVRFIRKEHGDYFGIAVAGYPEGHTECTSLEDDIRHLKDKIDAGADFVISQLFYDVDNYIAWVKKCRDAGITAPLIPGIMPIQNYAGFMRMTGFCKTLIPSHITEALESIKDDDAAVKAYGVELASETCRRLLEEGEAPGLHFYTLNLEKSVVDILTNLDFIVESPVKLPWRQSRLPGHQNETSRPIFWSNRPYSYINRTKNCFFDEYTNFRHGISDSPGFSAELALHYLYNTPIGTAAQRRGEWGEVVETVEQMNDTFVKYIEGSVNRLPWSDGPLQLETTPLKEQLKVINKNGILTINSQPAVNAAPSDDPAVGWGGQGGYVYQKAYIEFFISPELFAKFLDTVKEFPNLIFNATTKTGEQQSNSAVDDIIHVVTWGVFPGKEILQPTVVDKVAFGVWKEEAFALWKSQWQSIYEKESKSYKFLENVHDTYYLVNVVDNDYIGGNIFAVFNKMFGTQ